MSQAIASPALCCNPCVDSPSTGIPGPQGATGAAGSNGTNGIDAFTTVAVNSPPPQPVMPAKDGGSVVVNTTSSTAGFAVGQVVYVQNWGYMQVAALPSSTSMTLVNLETTAGAYASNAEPGISLAAASKITSGGIQGVAGISPAAGAPATATYITQTPDGTLSAEQALSLLGSGLMFSTTGTGVVSIRTVGILDANIPPVDDVGGLTNGEVLQATPLGIQSVNAATARSTISAQQLDALLTAMSALVTAADQLIYTTGVDTVALTSLTAFARTLLDDATAIVARVTLGISRAPQDILIYQHQMLPGVDAGDFTSGAWRTVPLNIEQADTGGHGSLAANTITLAQGTYRVKWRMCGYQVDRFQSRLFNVTTAVIAGLGSNAKSAAADTNMTESHGEARIIITAATEDIRIEAQCETTNVGDGFGIANAFGGTQTYAGIWLEREANV